MSHTTIKTRELINEIEELHADVASLKGDVDNLNDEIRDKIREMKEVQRIAQEKLAELEATLEEAFEEEHDDLIETDPYLSERDDFDVNDDDDYRSMEGLLEEIEGWVDEAND